MTTAPISYTLTTVNLAKNGVLSTATISDTLIELIVRLESLAYDRNLPLFCEPAGAQVEVIGSKLHRKTWRWFLDATPAQGGIVELHSYPAGTVDTFLCYHRANMVPAEKALTADHIPYYEGETLHTDPAPHTRAMVEAYAQLINTHVAKELDCTLERVSCELSGDMRTFNLPAHPAF